MRPTPTIGCSRVIPSPRLALPYAVSPAWARCIAKPAGNAASRRRESRSVSGYWSWRLRHSAKAGEDQPDSSGQPGHELRPGYLLHRRPPAGGPHRAACRTRPGQEVFCCLITVLSLVVFTCRGWDAVGGGCAGDDVHVESAAAADYPRSDAGCEPQRGQPGAGGGAEHHGRPVPGARR